ncbi:flagellar filament capping protein FliD [Pseudodesulfovibrio piezophilus]|uniref:Flagellar hook-associated protein 2 n=1 Tax=Pseudodesulfovibrio piezophilus (strain DSM 21447 / JCM 15486 / C1TLV30) TaxID=1322246 RepID=M1WL21_PSEP2|nr:flagellar filament capping protein FliD [Pseudodesulfovibrio piezophilus]CCH50586.1 Flagellar hook-associated 2 domain protein [Pseudodesulfovibrio piezophilus C1TLV30]
MADDTYSSGSINFTGLGNGTDFNQLIDGLVDAEMVRVDRLENWKASWEIKSEEFKSLNTQMLSLKTALQSIDTINEFMAKTVNSTNSTLLTATADSSAQEASHTIEIGQLATNDVHITNSGVSDLSATITDSNTSFSFSYAGETVTISNISAGTTLEGFVNIINNHADSKDLVRASTIFDGSVYHLQINGLDQGGDNQLVISNAGDIIFSASDFHETQNAQNSQIRVNGFPSAGGGWIERSSNSINDIIEGITLNLNQADPGTNVQVNIVTDTAEIKNNVIKFIDQVNVVRAQIQAITDVDEDGEGSILTGNYGIDMISQKLKNITADLGLGFVPWDQETLRGDHYSALSQFGILTDAEEGSTTYGLLKLDDELFDEVLQSDPDAIAELFAANNIGESQSPDYTFTSLIEGTTKPGIYDVSIISDGNEITSATINGEPASISGWEITGTTGDSLGMAIRLDNTGAGTYDGTVSVKMGKAGELVDELTALTKPYNEFTYEGGPLAVLQDNYKDIMDNIDSKIEYETTRIEKLERNMKLKYARLDALLGQYELQQGQLESSLAQLE